MIYFTHIPHTTYAHRHQSFLTEREEARRSLSNCWVMQGAMLSACEAKLRRNYLDVTAIEKGVRHIVKLSNLIRKLSPVAAQPDPPRHEPIPGDISEIEDRTYGGVKASRLVRVLRFLRNLKRLKNDTAVAKRVLRMSDRLVGGLDIYKRVRALVANLTRAVDAPATAITPRPNAIIPVRKVSVRWEVSPQKIYGWKTAYHRKGYDPRQTSVYWLEKQAAALKRAVYKDYHSIPAPKVKVRPASQPKRIEVRKYIPPQGAEIIDQIWPPIDLVRMIEERRAHIDDNPALPHLSFRTKRREDAEPRDTTVESQNREHHVFCGVPALRRKRLGRDDRF